MLAYRFATIDDVDLFFKWVNDSQARANSYNKDKVLFSEHEKWFANKLSSPDQMVLVFQQEETPVGQVRTEKISSGKALISVMVDEHHRGKGFATVMIKMASDHFLQYNPGSILIAHIFKTNKASLNSFLKAGFQVVDVQEIKGILSFILHNP